MDAEPRSGTAAQPTDPTPRARWIRRKPAGVLLAVLGAGAVLLTGSRSWVTGTVTDAVLGKATIAATGSDVAPGLSALALVVIAAAVAAVSGGRAVRVVSLVAEGAALVAVAVLIVRVLLDPSGPLGPVAAASVGRSGSIPTVAAVTSWPWLAAVGWLVAVVGWTGAVAGARSWSGPSVRYERRQRPPAGNDPGTATGARGQRVTSAWEQLDAGLDPTDVGEDSQT